MRKISYYFTSVRLKTMSKVNCPKCDQELDPIETSYSVYLHVRNPHEIVANIRQNKLSVQLKTFFGSKGTHGIILGTIILGLTAYANKQGWLTIPVPAQPVEQPT